jgi:hypothetical protein
MNDPHDNEQADQAMLRRQMEQLAMAPPVTDYGQFDSPAGSLARQEGAFDRVSITVDRGGRTRRPEWPYRVEVHRPAVPPSATSSGRVATMEHMNLDRDELAALGDRIWEALKES